MSSIVQGGGKRRGGMGGTESVADRPPLGAISCGYFGIRITRQGIFRKIATLIGLGQPTMSMLDDFVRMRLYRERASEFDLLAETEVSPDVRLRFRTVARHYRDLAGCVEQADKARMAERLERLRRIA